MVFANYEESNKVRVTTTTLTSVVRISKIANNSDPCSQKSKEKSRREFVRILVLSWAIGGIGGSSRKFLFRLIGRIGGTGRRGRRGRELMRKGRLGIKICRAKML